MNNQVDNYNVYLNKVMKLLINILLYYIFLNILFCSNLTTSQNILIIIVFSVLAMYILDNNFPSCKVIL